MARVWDDITEAHREFIGNQPVFFVATAPSDTTTARKLTPVKSFESRSRFALKPLFLDIEPSRCDCLKSLAEPIISRLSLLTSGLLGLVAECLLERLRLASAASRA